LDWIGLDDEVYYGITCGYSESFVVYRIYSYRM